MANSRITAQFQGTPKLIRLTSDSVGYGPQPSPDAEVEQRLTITADGRVFFSAFHYADGLKYTKARSIQGRIAAETASGILDQICAFFSESDKEFWATDVGSWTLAVTNTDGMSYLYQGPLCFLSEELTEISNGIRETLDMPELYLFDGAGNKDRIEKLVLEYQQIEKRQSPEHALQEREEFLLRYYERVVIDRKEGIIGQLQQYGTGCEVKKEICSHKAVCNLLDEIYTETLFSETRGNPSNVIADPHIERNYRMTVVYWYGDQQQIVGSFDKNGLPTDYPEFAEAVLGFLQHFVNVHELLNPDIYERTLRRESDYIYLSVVFDEYGKDYYYTTTDDTIETGDLCLVPAGKDDHEAVARVVKVEYFAENEVPRSPDKTKAIIRKYESTREGE